MANYLKQFIEVNGSVSKYDTDKLNFFKDTLIKCSNSGYLEIYGTLPLENKFVFSTSKSGDIIGYAHIIKEAIGNAMLCTLEVLKDNRRKGIGSALVKNSINVIPQQWLRLSPSQGKGNGFLKKFYTDLGFKEDTAANTYYINAMDCRYNAYIERFKQAGQEVPKGFKEMFYSGEVIKWN